ncbi:secreted and transmembrane protein 1 isoform X5 [Ictidomys tridecemlineatus]
MGHSQDGGCELRWAAGQLEDSWGPAVGEHPASSREDCGPRQPLPLLFPLVPSPSPAGRSARLHNSSTKAATCPCHQVQGVSQKPVSRTRDPWGLPHQPAMGTWPSESPGRIPQPCVPSMLGILLLLAASLSAQNSSWDRPSCTEGVVSVPRGQRAVMACNMSNAFTNISIRLHAHGKTVTIFEKRPPGRFSRDGWTLQVHGGQAQLVITAAQDAHAGQYEWRLRGLQRTTRATYLNVSGTASQVPGSERLQARSQATPQSMVGALVAVLLLILAVGSLGWCWRRRSPKCVQVARTEQAVHALEAVLLPLSTSRTKQKAVLLSQHIVDKPDHGQQSSSERS